MPGARVEWSFHLKASRYLHVIPLRSTLDSTLTPALASSLFNPNHYFCAVTPFTVFGTSAATDAPTTIAAAARIVTYAALMCFQAIPSTPP